MKRKNEGQKSMDLEKPVALTDEEVARRNDEIRGLIRANKGLRREMADATRAGKKSIKENDERIDVLMEQIDQGLEMRKQGTLFADKQALAGVAAAAGEPKPSEPHAFKSSMSKPFECVTCGSSPTDPIHPEKPAPAGKASDNGAGDDHPSGPVDIAKARAKKRGSQTSARKGARA